MKALVEKVNHILAEWDPIGVGETIAIEEYKGYIPTIIKFANDKKMLMDYLASVLVNDIGLDYDSSNESHIKDLQQVCEKIIQEYNISPRSA